MRTSDVVAVVTAAGRSTRMGRAKALVEWRGLPLLTHQVRALLACREVVVVLGHEAHLLQPFVPTHARVRTVFNPRYDEGRGTSLATAFGLVRSPVAGVLVVAVDQPLADGVVQRLCEACRPEFAVLQPSHEGRRGHPVLFRGDLLPELQAVAAEPEGLRSVVRRHDGATRLVPVPDRDVLRDLNTPADWAEA
ncbi:MAG: nucleotidyltransferase family protein [Candidatus Sericytochromatia bacterium]|nr:nucleotidyltransferase family protein [Candidatus Sericytochromatia bacterium]